MNSALALRRYLIKCGIDPDGPPELITAVMEKERAKLTAKFNQQMAKARQS
ncbi:MAG: hypothetical protein JOY99_05330 [Sphingomonadaceae bacterium]|nr:hypothetical protein [Sphingomonadaceae bacterium]